MDIKGIDMSFVMVGDSERVGTREGRELALSHRMELNLLTLASIGLVVSVTHPLPHMPDVVGRGNSKKNKRLGPVARM